MSCDYNQLLLESYKEQTVSWKHEDNTLYKFGAVLLPVTFVALGVPFLCRLYPLSTQLVSRCRRRHLSTEVSLSAVGAMVETLVPLCPHKLIRAARIF